MKDKIKEILAYFEEYIKITEMHDSEPMLNWKDLKIVLDYITNLQTIEQQYSAILSENAELKNELENKITNLQEKYKRLRNDYGRLMQDNAYTLELEQRIDKAIEYIEERKTLNWYADGIFVWELLNILQGEDNE